MSYNPTNSITGNGVSGQVTATFATGNSFWNIVTQDLPGSVLTGTFPNDITRNLIQQQNLSFVWPIRGGKNIPNPNPRPTIPSGEIGITSVGIPIYSPRSGITVTGQSGTIWNLNSVETKVFGEDIYGGRPTSTGLYHYHSGEFVFNNAWGNIDKTTWIGGSYTQFADGHSKLIGWAKDGYPIYGPYGYQSPNDIFSPVVRMESGYQLSPRTNRPVSRNIVVNGAVTSATSFLVYSSSGITVGMTLSGGGITTPTKVVSVFGTRIGVKDPITLVQGSIVTASYDLGSFVEDWAYFKSSDNVLDQFNGRYCVTPEYPDGTYAYFITETEQGKPTYPYVVGPAYYGSTSADNTDTRLTNIIPSVGVLDPSFSSTITNYSVVVENPTTSTRFTAFISNPLSSIKFNGVSIGSGETSPSVPLLVGLTTSTFEVTSQYKSVGTYKITVSRVKKSSKNLSNITLSSGSLSPAFDPAVTNYTVTYETARSSISVIANKADLESSIAINGVPIDSGSAFNVELDFGVNTISILVTAEDLSTQTYTIYATRLSNLANLSSITTNAGAIVPAFNSNTYYYSLSVVNTVTNISISADTSSSLSPIYIDGILTSPNVFSSPISLTVGYNPIGINVVSSDGTVTQTYRLNVFREKSDVSRLSGLSVSTGTLTPSFNSNITSYTVNLANSVTGLSFTPTAEESNSQIRVNGILVTSGTASQRISLSVGSNLIEVQVTSHSGNYQTSYIITAVRATSTISSLSNLIAYNTVLTPTFSSGTFNYSDTVSYNIQDTKIRATSTDANSTIRVNNVSVISGEESQSIPLVVGINTVTTVVTAQSGINTSTYRITLTRKPNFDAYLALLKTNIGDLVPRFDPNIESYDLSLSNGTTQLDITAISRDNQSSRITVSNGLYSVTTSTGATVTIPLEGNIENNQWNGLTAIDVTVLAADSETTKTYTINAVRGPNTYSNLTDLSINIPGLTPTFETDTTEYYLAVPYTTTNIRVTATAGYPLQDIYINGVLTTSTYQSELIPLYVGNNTIPVIVYADDRNYFTGYNIFVNRASQGLDTNSKLANIELSTGTFTTKFDPDVTEYSINLPYSATAIKVKPIKEKSSASVKVNNQNVISGMFSQDIPVPVGSSTITLVVTAQDNSTKTTYTISINRSGNVISTLKDLYVSFGTLDRNFDPTVTQYTVKVKNIVDKISVRPFTSDNQAVLAINGLPEIPNEWSPPIPLNIGDNIVTIRVVSGDLRNETIYQVKFIRDVAVVTDPTEIFLTDGKNLRANFIDTNLLRVFTRVDTENIQIGYFPNMQNTWSTSLQNLEIVFPYRAGTIEQASIKPLRPDHSPIGITIVGVPIHGPENGGIIRGPNNSVWNIDAVVANIYGGDQYGGLASEFGYTYKDNRFINSGAWDNFPGWTGVPTHPDGHSRLIGYAVDGFPIYGPYGYSNPTNRYSTVTEMVSAYSLKIGPNRPGNVTVIYNGNEINEQIQLESVEGLYIGMRLTAPALEAFSDISIVGINTETKYITLTQPVFLGPFAYQLTASFHIGSFVEDNYYDPNKVGATLDKHNGRYCVTPEYPYGTYAYFSTGATAPAYPYFVGNTIFGALSTIDPSVKSLPKWITPVGFLVTATEGISISRTVSANGGGVSYKLLSGSLPSGLKLNTSTGVISGTPSIVYQTLSSDFVVRAANKWGVADRKFSIDVRGATPPIITTPGPRPSIGPSGERYLVNGQIVDFQFTATADILPAGKSLFFFIEDGDGQLPPGLTLTSSGRLYGQVEDDLSLFYRAGNDGRYDVEAYDVNPFEHQSQQEFGIKNRFVNKVYRFFLTVSNGLAVKKAEYIIDVNDPATYVEKGPYPVPVQWISPTNLGSFRANTNVVIQLETHDCDPGGGTITYDWFIANNGDPQIDRLGLSLDGSTGVISGFLRYTPVYTTTKQFKMRVYKNNILTNKTSYREKTFNITILGSVISSLTFSTPTNVGTLYQGEQSELSILAIHSDSTLSVTYSLESGSLPPGLSLSIDGAIQGKVDYNVDSITPATYNFSVKARDSSLTNEVTANFTITVRPYTGKKFTSIYMQPLLKLESRYNYDQFITDQTIFDPELLYRRYDDAFGVQSNIKFVLEHAIEESNVADYVPALQKYFSRKRLEFGSLKSAFATDELGNITYEVVYVELIDNLVTHEGVQIGSSVAFNNTTVYPNSINNMRGALEELGQVDEYLWPKFMRTIQSDTGIPLGRILCMPLCYCLPGKSQTVINRINNSNFDFKMINFEVDRIIVENTKDTDTAKYLLFPNREV